MSILTIPVCIYELQLSISSRFIYRLGQQQYILIIYPDAYTPLMAGRTNVEKYPFKPMEIYGNVSNCTQACSTKVLPRKMRLFNIAYNVCTYLENTLREDQFLSTKWRSISSVMPRRPDAQCAGCTKGNQYINTITLVSTCIEP